MQNKKKERKKKQQKNTKSNTSGYYRKKSIFHSLKNIPWFLFLDNGLNWVNVKKSYSDRFRHIQNHYLKKKPWNVSLKNKNFTFL